jgi:hypothetical protein
MKDVERMKEVETNPIRYGLDDQEHVLGPPKGLFSVVLCRVRLP